MLTIKEATEKTNNLKKLQLTIKGRLQDIKKLDEDLYYDGAEFYNTNIAVGNFWISVLQNKKMQSLAQEVEQRYKKDKDKMDSWFAKLGQQSDDAMLLESLDDFGLTEEDFEDKLKSDPEALLLKLDNETKYTMDYRLKNIKDRAGPRKSELDSFKSLYKIDDIKRFMNKFSIHFRQLRDLSNQTEETENICNDEDDIIETYNDMIFMLQKAIHNQYLKNMVFYGQHTALDDIVTNREKKEDSLIELDDKIAKKKAELEALETRYKETNDAHENMKLLLKVGQQSLTATSRMVQQPQKQAGSLDLPDILTDASEKTEEDDDSEEEEALDDNEDNQPKMQPNAKPNAQDDAKKDVPKQNKIPYYEGKTIVGYVSTSANKNGKYSVTRSSGKLKGKFLKNITKEEFKVIYNKEILNKRQENAKERKE